jgi:poly(A) polymerase
MTVSMKKLPSLSNATWLNEPRLQAVMRAISAAGGEVRVAGGAVRNSLLSEPISDVDLATTMLPQDVMRACKSAGFGVHPTGIDHGTITVVNHGQPFEVTTLRLDVETDGRRAVVAFTDDWNADAQRRDFTINAMYCDFDGKIYDFTDGYDDILRRRVRFVGVASARIKEDYLRILRFFRFHAWYGKAVPDKASLAACVELKSGLKKISAERVRQEMFKLLVAPRAVATLKVMAASGILNIVLPYTEEWRVIERLSVDAVLRLFVLAQNPDELKERFRLSNDDALRIGNLNAAPDLSPKFRDAEQRMMLYQVGAATWRDAVRVAWAKSRSKLDDAKWQALLDLPQRWPVPKFPVTGKDLIAAGVQAGPEMGDMLSRLEDWWVACDFAPSRDELLQRIEDGK